MSKTLQRILSFPSKHALSNDFKWHVTLISAKYLIILINLSFETVSNAPIMIGTTVTFAPQFLDPFQLPLHQVLVLLIFFLSRCLSVYLEVKCTSNINNQGHSRSILFNTTILSFLCSVLLSVCILNSHSSLFSQWIHTVTLVSLSIRQYDSTPPLRVSA